MGIYTLPVTAGPKEFQELVNSLINKDVRAGEGDEYNFFNKTKEIKNRLDVFFQQTQYTDF